jgi:hypothetical protein
MDVSGLFVYLFWGSVHEFFDFVEVEAGGAAGELEGKPFEGLKGSGMVAIFGAVGIDDQDGVNTRLVLALTFLHDAFEGVGGGDDFEDRDGRVGDDLLNGAIAVEQCYVWDEIAMGRNLHSEFRPNAKLRSLGLLLEPDTNGILPSRVVVFTRGSLLDQAIDVFGVGLERTAQVFFHGNENGCGCHSSSYESILVRSGSFRTKMEGTGLWPVPSGCVAG